MYDICHCGGIKHKKSVRCTLCRYGKAMSIAPPDSTGRPVRFSDDWASSSEIHDLLVADMKKWNFGPAQLADKAGCDRTSLLDFLAGRIAVVPKAIASYYGFVRANAWVRL